MAATPSDIAKYTTDGVVLTTKDQAIKDADPNAQDTGDDGLEWFFDDPDDGALVAAVRWSFLSSATRPHEAVETGDSLGLGSVVPIVPYAPRVDIRDDSRNIRTNSIVRSYSFDMSSDSYALECVGSTPGIHPGEGNTFDSDIITLDAEIPTWDTTEGSPEMPPGTVTYEGEVATYDGSPITYGV